MQTRTDVAIPPNEPSAVETSLDVFLILGGLFCLMAIPAVMAGLYVLAVIE